MLSYIYRRILLGVSVSLLLFFSACTQDAQNELGRSILDWTGTDGVLDVYAGDKLVRRFVKIDKLTTPSIPAKSGSPSRSARKEPTMSSMRTLTSRA